MIDVAGMTVGDLTVTEAGPALTQSLRRVTASLDDPAEPIAGFNSAL